MANKATNVNPDQGKVSSTASKQRYYPALDGLRFFAFLLVFLHHSLLNFHSLNPIINFFLIGIIKNGWIGVDLFFVLSGFLITTLLLEERKIYGKFSLKNFWIRRALRIWPLYFLALLTGFFIYPLLFHEFDLTKVKDEIFYYLFFLGNWKIVQSGYSQFTDISHLWTISLEEQFYFLWPLVLLFIKNIKQALLVGFFIILAAFIARFYLALNLVSHPGIYVNTFARIDTLTLGAILALCLFYQPNWFSKIKNFLRFPLQFLMLLLLFFLMYRIFLFDPRLTIHVVFGYFLFALIMAYFTLSSIEPNTIFSTFLSQKIFVFLGKISYGLYIWHILAIELSVKFLPSYFPNYIHPILAFILTVIFGIVSYHFFELPFLKLKEKFARISSRPV